MVESILSFVFYELLLFFFCLLCFVFFVVVVVIVAISWAAPTAYGDFQARGSIRATAAGLHHSSWQRRILNPLSEARDRTQILIDINSLVRYC